MLPTRRPNFTKLTAPLLRWSSPCIRAMSELLFLLPESEVVVIFEVLIAVFDCMTIGSVVILRNGCYYFPIDTA